MCVAPTEHCGNGVLLKYQLGIRSTNKESRLVHGHQLWKLSPFVIIPYHLTPPIGIITFHFSPPIRIITFHQPPPPTWIITFHPSPPFEIIQFPLFTTEEIEIISYTHCRRVISWVAPKMHFGNLEMAALRGCTSKSSPSFLKQLKTRTSQMDYLG